MGRKSVALIIVFMLLCESAFAGVLNILVDSSLFPDDTFRKIILESYDIDGDKILSSSEQKNIGTIQAEEWKIFRQEVKAPHWDYPCLYCGNDRYRR